MYQYDCKQQNASNAITPVDKVQELPWKKEGRPLLLPDEFNWQVQEYLKELRKHGLAINSACAIVIEIAQGIIMNKNANLLSCNGGGINLTTG